MNKISKTVILGAILTLGYCGTINAQQGTVTSDGYSVLPSGLQYKIVKHGKGTLHPKLTDHVEININVQSGDSVVFDSRRMNDNKPVPVQIQPRYKGDPLEGVMMMVVGDSALLRLSIDSLKAMGMAQPWMKSGEQLSYRITLNSLKTDEEMKKEKILTI